MVATRPEVLPTRRHRHNPLQNLWRADDPLVTKRERGGTSYGVGDVIVSAGRMVDTVLARACGSAFKPAKLSYKTRMVEQFEPVGI